ncbi:mechanosensitive ion channel family protein [Brevibacillus sp. SYP-B805]|uniref:mechanosensitive ion channel family protein n=1 Tax=Brevibacillus sp. SYP-B805 TaxID=1578199 RepID=UPI0013EC9CBE|nr:mechanosensitive ion channel family protein [Brevibacillus sp. SYP-B805]NGQ96088.1 mechanosensitive ion channel family protein [Brevibacillus sp. SYP-B805]
MTSQQVTWYNTLYRRILDYVTNEQLWINIGLALVKIIAIIIAAKVVVSLTHAFVNRIFQNREGSRIQFERRRVDTLRVLINNVTTYIIYFLAILMVLKQLGFDLQPVLVSAGVVGLAVGFGAQSLVRDVITGFFIIFEDQFAVGDVVTINNFNGTVQEIGLRVTRIRSWTGEVHIIPNGSIKQVTNFSVQNTMAVVDVSVAYEEDLEYVEKVIAEVAKQLKQETEEIVGDPQVLGVQAFGPSDVIIRVVAECKPNTHYAVARKLRAMIKREFDARGIEIPYPKTVTVTMPSDKARLRGE